MAVTLMATSRSWEATKGPCLVPSILVNSTNTLTYLKSARFSWEFQRLKLFSPFKVGDMLVVVLGTNLDDFGEEFISVACALCLVHVNHQFFHDFHQIFLGNLQQII